MLVQVLKIMHNSGGGGGECLQVLSRRYRDLTGVSTGSEDNAQLRGWECVHVLSRRYTDLTGVSTGSEDNAQL